MEADVGCYKYSSTEIVDFNFFVFTIFFYLGLQFSHMKQLPGMNHFVLEWRFMINWSVAQWSVFLLVIFAIVAQLTILSSHYSQAGVAGDYVIWGILLFSYFYIRSRYCDRVHIHHYTLAMIVISFTGYQSAFVTAVCGIWNGVMIEGASFFGYDIIFDHFGDHLTKQALDVSRIKIEN